MLLVEGVDSIFADALASAVLVSDLGGLHRKLSSKKRKKEDTGISEVGTGCATFYQTLSNVCIP